MNRTFRGVVSAWMVLIVLRTVGTSGGSGAVTGLFTEANGLVMAALSPGVPAIRDRREGAPRTPTPRDLLSNTFQQYSLDSQLQVRGRPSPR